VTLAPPGPIPGYLLIADRGNNRMLLVDSKKRIFWHYPKPGVRPSMPFRFGDDTFFGPEADRIISNQEDQNTIQIISFPAGRVLWRYGHVNAKGSAPGYLNTPDDAYLLRDGLVTVADAYNCRVLFINPAHRIVFQYGTTGTCTHGPPRKLGAVNGATPLPDGGVLISEINGSWIDDLGPNGRLRWAVQAPLSYPSDPQLLGANRILVADYAHPGGAIIMTTTGHVVWKYAPASGPGELNHPSLATLIAPGLIAINDDFRDRVVLVSIRTKRIVWQYGHTDVPGRTNGYLNTPDGLDLLPTADAQRSPAIRALLLVHSHPASAAPNQSTPSTHSSPVTIGAARYRLPAPVERELALPVGHSVVLAGGLDATGQSTSGVFRLDLQSGKLTQLGAVPQPFHDAAGALLGTGLIVFGGGSSQSSSAVQRFDLASRTARVIGQLPRALSDLASATVGNAVYLIGGYDGHVPRPEIYRTTDGVQFRLVGRLPVGLRYPAVTVVGTRVVIAGGVTPGGTASSVYEFDATTARVSVIGRLPAPVAHASAVVVGGFAYIVGGADAAGHTVGAVTRIDLDHRSVTTMPGSIVVSDSAAVSLGDHALLFGGSRSGTAVSDVRELRLR
jgi:outer membrane protein assembly factor BamB